MIKTKTLFVVGAGASVGFGFPLGAKLATQIAATLRFTTAEGPLEQQLIRRAIAHKAQQHGFSPAALSQKCLEVSERLATAKSIDALIHNHADDEAFGLAGKLAIASCLLVAEQRSPLNLARAEATLDLRGLSETWLAHLFDILANGVSARSPEKIFDNVAFVVFNYDRCVERYLRYALANRFGMPLADAKGIVERLQIVHPYGSLGNLDGDTDFGIALEPGVHPASDTIFKMADGLLTFSQSMFANVDDIRRFAAEAERAVFLGFAFHPQNVKLLTAPSNIAQVVATTFGMSETSRKAALTDIQSMWSHSRCTIDNLSSTKCEEFVADEQRYLER